MNVEFCHCGQIDRRGLRAVALGPFTSDNDCPEFCGYFYSIGRVKS